MNIVTIVMCRDCVMLLMRDIDPESVRQCTSRIMVKLLFTTGVVTDSNCQGPNFTWHIDQYDKLSAFGFCFHGCIDG